MSKQVELTGQRFGSLTVIRPTDKRNGHGSILWECLCDCGNITLAASDRLKGGHKKSCGCVRANNITIGMGRKKTIGLSDIQKEIILALVDCSMVISAVARKLYTCSANVNYHVKEIERKTGKNPRRFSDLVDLAKMVKGDANNG